MKNLWMVLAVSGGGAAGALVRWGVSAAMMRVSAGPGVLYGTFTVNIVGCFLAGLLYVWLVEQQAGGAANQALRLALAVGFLGAMTTFSAFGVETVNLLGERRYGVAAGYVLLSVALGLAAVAGGMALARKL